MFSPTELNWTEHLYLNRVAPSGHIYNRPAINKFFVGTFLRLYFFNYYFHSEIFGYWHLQFHFSVVTFTQERVEQLQQLSKQPDIYERLAKALGMRKIWFISISFEWLGFKLTCSWNCVTPSTWLEKGRMIGRQAATGEVWCGRKWQAGGSRQEVEWRRQEVGGRR